MMLVLAAVACGLPAQTGGPAPAPADSVLPTSSPEPEEPISLSLSEAITAGVEAGTWTESAGIISGLRYLVGELSPEETFGATPLLNGEGTAVIRTAQTYLEDASNVEGRGDIERLLAILVPSRETLDRFSQRAASSVTAPGLARVSTRPMGDRAECQALWASGFASPLPVVCLEYEELAVDGRTYRVYYPSYWPEDHPGRALLGQAFGALEDSVRLFNTYGPEPVFSTDIVFTDLDALVRDEETLEWLRAPSIYAAADHPPNPADRHCPVGIFPAAVVQAAESEGAFRQTIAHELFHCYQFTNLTAEEAGPARSATEWWVEGSAEFFGSVVYPDANDEFQYLPGFKSRSSHASLLTFSYHAYPFFLYLARQAALGPEGVIDLLQAMPETGGLDGQQEALAGYPGIQEAFHEFGRAYLDRQLQDYGGGPLPVDATEGALATFGVGEGEGFFPTQAFVLERYRLSFVDDTRFTVAKVIEGDGKHGARPLSAVGAWAEVPTELNTACGDREFLLLVTSAIPPGSEPLAMTVTTFGERVEEEQPCDECVIGTWQLDNSSYLAHMGGLWPILMTGVAGFGLDTGGAESHPTDVFGEMSMTFKTDNTVNGTQSGWGIAGEATGEDGTVHASMTYNGEGTAAWRIMENEEDGQRYLFFDGGSFSLSGQMTFEIFPLRPISFGESNDSVFLSSPQPFLCDATTLTYYAQDPLGPVIFFREDFESPEPGG